MIYQYRTLYQGSYLYQYILAKKHQLLLYLKLFIAKRLRDLRSLTDYCFDKYVTRNSHSIQKFVTRYIKKNYFSTIGRYTVISAQLRSCHLYSNPFSVKHLSDSRPPTDCCFDKYVTGNSHGIHIFVTR